MTGRERDAAIAFIVVLFSQFVAGTFWGLGMALFDAVSLAGFLVWGPAGAYLVYRLLRRGYSRLGEA